MSAASEELYSLLVPLNEDRLIVPRACVAEVVRLSQPTHVAGAPDWMVGHLDWSGRNVPALSFEAMLGRAMPENTSRTRVVIFHATSGQVRGGFYGILTQGFPQLVRVNRDVLEVDHSVQYNDDDPVVTRVRMINEYPLIPDLDVIEQRLADVLPALAV
ncbi:MAG: chemotaxis protein CheW [Pseudomonadota bacterium]